MKLITVALLFLLTIPGLAAPKQPAFEIVEIEGAYDTRIRGINDNGDISGTVLTNQGEFGFIRRGSQVTLLSVPGGVGTEGWGIDNEGRVAGHFWNLNEPFSPVKGFIYENGQYTVVSHPTAIPYPGTQLFGINAGRAVGIFYDSPASSHGFLVENGQFTFIDVPGASATWPQGINAAGKVVGSYYGGGSDSQTSHGFTWQNGQFETFDYPQPGASTGFVATNSDTIVGSYYSGGACDFSLFLLRRGKFQLLDLPGISVYAINESGTIVGDYGRNRGVIINASRFILRGQ